MINKDGSIAYFISSHGYGHAARAAALMDALCERGANQRFEVFTLAPEWFFGDSLPFSFGYHPVFTDIGMVQKDSLIEDVPGTLRLLDDFFPLKEALVDRLAEEVIGLGCRLVLCDISPLGIIVARRAAIPSVLIENFTWDWIYESYAARAPGFRSHIDYLRDLFRSADYHIQTLPVCRREAAAFLTNPVSRKFRRPADTVRRELGLSHETKVALITMGGISWDYRFIERLRERDDCVFILLGVAQQREKRNNLVLLPHHSGFFHPDLINASDAVVGKVGYSTIAEVLNAGVPFGYIRRTMFPESAVLVSFIEHCIQGIEISPAEFQTGNWLSRLDELLSLPRLDHTEINGADQAADFISVLM